MHFKEVLSQYIWPIIRFMLFCPKTPCFTVLALGSTNLCDQGCQSNYVVDYVVLLKVTLRHEIQIRKIRTVLTPTVLENWQAGRNLPCIFEQEKTKDEGFKNRKMRYRDISFLPLCYPTFALRHLLSMSNAPYLFAIQKKVLHTTLSSDIRFPDLLGQQIFANWFSYDLLLRLLLLVLNGCETFAIQDICYLRHLLSETITIFYDSSSDISAGSAHMFSSTTSSRYAFAVSF